MNFRYVPKNIFDIKTEIVIFDDKIAFYTKDEFTLIQNKNFTNSQKQLFNNVWEE
jgi:RecA-family ATPase